MIRKLLIIIITFTIITLLTLFSLKINSTEKSIQLKTDRIYSKSLELSESIKLDKDLSLMKIVDNKIFFVSWTFNNQGKIFSLNITDDNYKLEEFDFLNENNLFIIENFFIENDSVFLQNSAEQFMIKASLKNNNQERITLSSNHINKVGKNNEYFILNEWDDEHNLSFTKFNYFTNKHEVIPVKNSYLDEYEYTGISLEGNFHSNKYNTTFVPYSINRIFIFDDKLNYDTSFDLIFDKLDFNFRGSGNELYIDPNNLNPNSASFLTEENILWILTKDSKSHKSDTQLNIDIYDINNREYSHSILLDNYEKEQPEFIGLYKDNLVILYRSFLNIYVISEKE